MCVWTLVRTFSYWTCVRTCARTCVRTCVYGHVYERVYEHVYGHLRTHVQTCLHTCPHACAHVGMLALSRQLAAWKKKWIKKIVATIHGRAWRGVGTFAMSLRQPCVVLASSRTLHPALRTLTCHHARTVEAAGSANTGEPLFRVTHSSQTLIADEDAGSSQPPSAGDSPV